MADTPWWWVEEGERKTRTPRSVAEETERQVRSPEERASNIQDLQIEAELTAKLGGYPEEVQRERGEDAIDPFVAPVRKGIIGGEPGALEDVAAVAGDVGRAFTRQRIEEDEPQQINAALQGRGSDLAQAGLLLLGAMQTGASPSIPGAIQKGLREQEKTFHDDQGIFIEQEPEQALLRAVGLGSENIVAEGLGHMRAPMVKTKGGEELSPGPASLADLKSFGERVMARMVTEDDPVAVLRDEYNSAELGHVRLERALLGTTPSDRGTLSDFSLQNRGKWTKPILRAAESTYQGIGLPEFFEAGAASERGRASAEVIANAAGYGLDEGQFEDAAWWAGMAASMIMPSEVITGRPALRLATALPQAKATAKKFDVGFMQALRTHLTENPTNMAEAIAEEGGHLLARSDPDSAFAEVADGVPADTRAILKDQLLSRGFGTDALQGEVPDVPVATPPRSGRAERIRKEMKRAPEEIRGDYEAALKDLEGPAVEALSRAEAEQLLRDLQSELTIPTNPGQWWQRFERVQKVFQGLPVEARRIVSGYNANKHEAGDMMKRLNAKQTPADPDYKVIDYTGEVVNDRLSYAQAHSLMATRQNRGDTVWYEGAGVRPVSGWRKSPGEGKPSEIAVDRHFSTTDEGVALLDLNKGNPRATMPWEVFNEQAAILQQDVITLGFGLGGDAVLHKSLRRAQIDMARMLGGFPPRDRFARKLTPKEFEFLDALRESVMVQMRNNGRLMRVKGNVYVTPAESVNIQRRMRKSMKAAGYDPESVKLKFTDEASPFTGREELNIAPKQRESLTRFLESHGVMEGLPEHATLADLRRLTDKVVQNMAGRTAQAKYALQGTASNSHAIATTLGTGMRGASAITDAHKGMMEQIFVSEATIKALPRGVRDIVQDSLRELESVGAEMVDDFRAFMQRRLPGGGRPTREDGIQHILPDYIPVTPAQIGHLQDSIKHPAHTAEEIFLARDKIISEAPGQVQYPGLYDNNPAVVKAAMVRYHREVKDRVETLGRYVIKSAIPGDQADEVFAKWGKGIRSDILQKAWTSYLRGGFEDEGITEVLSELPPKAQEFIRARPDAKEALVVFIARLRAEESTARIVRKMLERGVGGASPRQVDAINKLLGGGEVKDWVMADFAAHKIAEWGLLPGQGGEFVKWNDAYVPTGIARELKAAQGRGIRFKSSKPSAQALSWLWNTYRWSITDPNPGFHLANWASMPFIAVQQMGPKNALSAASVMFKEDPVLVGELTRRLTGGPAGRMMQRDPGVLITKGGDIYSVEELERLVRRLGVGETFRGSMTAQNIADDIDRISGEWNAFNRWRVEGHPGKAAAVMQEAGEALRSFSEVPERLFRISTFIDELKHGAAPEAAAEAARQSLFDYTQLSDLDRNVMRKLIVFWTFHRKNLDAFLKAVADHPERTGAILRVAHRQRAMWDKEDRDPVRLSRLRESDLTRMVLPYEARSEDGRAVELSTASAIVPAEAMFLIQGLVPEIAGGTGMTSQQMLGTANPIAKAMVEGGTGVVPGTRFKSDSPLANIMPLWLVDNPAFASVGQSFRPVPYYLKPGDEAKAQGEDENGAYVWVAHPEERGRWRAYQQFGIAGRFASASVPQFLTASKALSGNVKDLPASSSTLIDVLAAFGFRASAKRDAEEQMDVLRTKENRVMEARKREITAGR